MEVAVSILKEKDNYINAINKFNFSNSNILHIDVMDNTFTDSLSFFINPNNITKLTNKKVQFHLMSNNLNNILDDYIKVNPDTIFIHYEVGDTNKYLSKIKESNIKTGLVINPNIFVEEIVEYLKNVDVLLIMSVEPGKGGQKFIESTIEKLKKVNELKKDYNFIIEVDGGINDTTIKLVNKYADIVVSGSFITDSDNYNNQINKLINIDD